MNKEDLIKLKEKLSKLSEEEKKERDLYLRNLALGEVQGPPTGYPSIDKPWLKYYTEEAIKSDVPKMTMYDYLVFRNQDNLDKIAINYYGNKLTYKELINNIDICAENLKKIGVKKGDIVSISLPSLPESVYLLYGLNKIGAIANMIDPRVSEYEMEEYIKETNSKFVFVADIAAFKLEGIKENTNFEKIIEISPSDSLPKSLSILYNLKNKKKKSNNNTNWKDFFDRNIKIGNYKSEGFEENLGAVLVHTGGTTGVPKAVQLSNENLNGGALQCEIAGFDFKSSHNWLNIMPPFIAYGVGNGLHLPLLCGMEVVLIPQFTPDDLPKLLNKYHPNHMVGAPSHWGPIIESEKMRNKDLSYIISPTVGGDKMPENLELEVNNFLQSHNCNYMITKGYGLTEVNAAVAACTSNETNKIGSVGIPFPLTNISIFDPNTECELKTGDIGEICVSGPNTMIGYFNNEEETKKMLRKHSDGKTWVHTGDLGRMDNDGNLFVEDRIKRMIVRPDGFKVFPNKIEKVINELPFVENSAVVGVRDYENSQGKIPIAHIVLKSGFFPSSNLKGEIIDYTEKKLPEYSLPSDIVFEKKLDLTKVGKIDTLSLEKKDDERAKLKIKKI